MASRSRASTSAGPAVSSRTSSMPHSAVTAASPPSVTTRISGLPIPVERRSWQRLRICGRSRLPSTRMTSALGVSTRAEPSAGATRTVCRSRPSAGSTSADGCSALVSRRSELIPGSPLSGSSRSRYGCRHSRMAQVPRWERDRPPAAIRRIRRRARQYGACARSPATPGAPLLSCSSANLPVCSVHRAAARCRFRRPGLLPARRCEAEARAVPAGNRWGWTSGARRNVRIGVLKAQKDPGATLPGSLTRRE